MRTPARRCSPRRSERGVTLIEVLITTVIVVVLAFLAKLGTNLMFDFYLQKTIAEDQRDASVVLYDIVRDVRNCRKVSVIQPGKLVLHMFDHRGSYDVNNFDFFDAVNVATVTYQYTSDSSGSRLVYSYVSASRNTQRQLLQNRLVTPTTADYLFRHYKGVVIDNPDMVEVAIRIKPLTPGKPSKVYEAETMRRATGAT